MVYQLDGCIGLVVALQVEYKEAFLVDRLK